MMMIVHLFKTRLLLLALISFMHISHSYQHHTFKSPSFRYKVLYQSSKSGVTDSISNSHHLLPPLDPPSPSTLFEVYEGMPLTDYDEIHQGVVLEELGLTLLVADSILTHGGKGLFLSLISQPSSSSSSSNMNLIDKNREQEDDEEEEEEGNQIMNMEEDNNGDNIYDNIEGVDIPSGQILCGYSKGTFLSKAEGDKCVGYLFNNISTNLVIYNKKLMTIEDMIIDVIQNHYLPSSSVDLINSNTVSLLQQIKQLIHGHEIVLLPSSSYSSSSSSLSSSVNSSLPLTSNQSVSDISSFLSHCKISIKSDFSERYFVPTPVDDANIESQVSVGNMGMYANDLAYNSQEGTYLTSIDSSFDNVGNNENVDDENKISLHDDESKGYTNSDSGGSSSGGGSSSSSSSSANGDMPIKFLNRNILQLVWRMELQKQPQPHISNNGNDNDISSSGSSSTTTTNSKRKLFRNLKKSSINNNNNNNNNNINNTVNNNKSIGQSVTITTASDSSSDNSSSSSTAYTLVPTWPVVIFSQDVSFINAEPNEVGLSYSYNYWQAVLSNDNSDNKNSN